MVAMRGKLLAKSVPSGVTEMLTVVPVSTAGPAGAAGAVYTSVARPSVPVTMLRADSVPKSATTPPTMISLRSERLRSGLPF